MQPPYGYRPPPQYPPPPQQPPPGYGPGYGQGYPPPPGYPQQQFGYYPPPRSSGVHPLAWVGLAMGLLFVFMIGGIFIFGMLRHQSAAPAYASGGGGGGGYGYDDTTDTTDDPTTGGGMAPNLPPPHRDVPVHDVKLLDGCSTGDLKMVENRIGDAIDVGAPAYNGGDFLGCYMTYDTAAQDIEKKLPNSCKGPMKALEDGRKKAHIKGTSADQAWAMRDAFDGLLDVIDRKGVDL